MFTMAPPELFYLYYTATNLLICHLALATIQSTLLIVSHEKHGFKHGDGSWNAKFWLPGHICSHHSFTLFQAIIMMLLQHAKQNSSIINPCKLLNLNIAVFGRRPI